MAQTGQRLSQEVKHCSSAKQVKTCTPSLALQVLIITAIFYRNNLIFLHAKYLHTCLYIIHDTYSRHIQKIRWSKRMQLVRALYKHHKHSSVLKKTHTYTQMENQKLPSRPSVVIVPFPFQGHLSPMLQLGTALHSRGFSIIIAHTIYNSPNPSNHPDFIFLPIVDNLPDNPDTSIEKRLDLVKTINTNCEEPLRDSLAQFMKKQDTEDQVVCIIYDTIMYCSEAVADHLKLPCLNFRTVPASVALLYDSLPMLAAEGHIPYPSMCSNFLVKNTILIKISRLRMRVTLGNYLNF